MNMRMTRRAFLVSATLTPAFPGLLGAEPTGAASQTSAGDDFYRYVNGEWDRSATIPPSRQSWSDFAQFEDTVAERTRIILERAMTSPRRETRAFGDLYATLTDRSAIERAGLAPIQNDLAEIDNVATPAGLARFLARIARETPRDPFGQVAPSDPVPATPIVFLDTMNPTRYRPCLIQGGLGLPDREYYLGDRPAYLKARELYRAYVAKLLSMAGSGEPVSRAAAVYALETRLAQSHRPRAELFDFAKRNNPTSVAALGELAPGFDWPTFLSSAGYGEQAEIVVADPQAFVMFGQAVSDAGWPVWRDYLRVKLLNAFALAGPSMLAQAHFDFHERGLKGVAAELPAWRKAAKLIDLTMGQAVGAEYRRAYLPRTAESDLKVMIGHIKTAMRNRIAAASWMAPSTKTAALEKLALLRVEVGGPPRIADYRRVPTKRVSAWTNLTTSAAFAYDLTLTKLNGPVDRGEWDMYPHSVNGMANPLLNKIMFSAGMMQPPIYDPGGDEAANYGALGAFVAHEVSHIFDNVGSRFDAQGRMRNWWTKEDRAAYDAAVSKLAAQFDREEILPGLRANGRQTLHENVADLGGLTLALDAYRLSIGKRTPQTGGEQRFFMAWARMWREIMGEDAARNKAAVGTHSMGRLRANTVRNIDAWYSAFDVQPGQTLYLRPEDRVRIW